MGKPASVRVVAFAFAFALAPAAMLPRAAQAVAPSIYVSVEDHTAHGRAATGIFSLVISSVGRPFTFDPHALHFFWISNDGRQTATPIVAALRIGTWTTFTRYSPYVDTSPDRYLERAYRAQLSFGTAPGPPGRYALTVDADKGFARTDRGVPLVLGTSKVVDAYWPDERNGDAAVANLRRRILGRVVYAFGGSLLACGGSHRADPFDVPLHVTRVAREVGAAYWLETGATGRAYPTSFVAIDPIDVYVNGCAPGFRFADPWQAGVSITTQRPPAGLAPGAAIVPGMSRNAVRWLLGYPDQFGSASSFNALARWEYAWPQGVFKAVTFARDRVTRYTASPNAAGLR